MKIQYFARAFVSLSLLIFFAQGASAQTLVGAYDTTTTPALPNNTVYHVDKVGNILYVGTDAGLSVIDTQGTETQVDDSIVGTYNTLSTPAITVGGGVFAKSFFVGNILYITTSGGLYAIDTQGTVTLSDDTLLKRYYTGSTPALVNNGVEDTFVSGNLLYVSTFGGLSVIDTQGTVTPTDDSALGTYSKTSTPAIPGDAVFHTHRNGNLLYISTSGNTNSEKSLTVVDTQGTSTFADDAVVTEYNTANTTFFPVNGGDVYYSFLFGNLLYIGTFFDGLTVINTQGTTAIGDDVLVTTYNDVSSPSIGTAGNILVPHAFRVGNLLYVSVYFGQGVTVIDTQGTETATDDTIAAKYDGIFDTFLDGKSAIHAAIFGNLLYISTDGGMAVVNIVDPVVATDPVNVSLQVGSTISITSPADVTMGAITGTGKSDLTTNSATWNIKTNNASGYALSWQASSADMTNLMADTLASYVPASPGVPEVWNVAATDSAWGARLSSNSSRFEAYDGQWGPDDQAVMNYGSTSKWLNVDTTPYVIATGGVTTIDGDDETVIFGGEIGASKIQPTGNYSVDVTMTATTL